MPAGGPNPPLTAISGKNMKTISGKSLFPMAACPVCGGLAGENGNGLRLCMELVNRRPLREHLRNITRSGKNDDAATGSTTNPRKLR